MYLKLEILKISLFSQPTSELSNKLLDIIFANMLTNRIHEEDEEDDFNDVNVIDVDVS